MSDGLTFSVGRFEDGRVQMIVEGDKYTMTYTMEKDEALRLGRAMMGAADFPAYQHDEPWATMDRIKRVKLLEEKKKYE
jgi:hypothetical protein